MGGITEIATSAPGYNSLRPNSAAPLAETLKLNGYATAQFGKCHEVPVWETSPMAEFNINLLAAGVDFAVTSLVTAFMWSGSGPSGRPATRPGSTRS